MNVAWRSLGISPSQRWIPWEILGLLWILALSTFIFIQQYANQPNSCPLHVLYAPPLVQIPDNVYSLSQSILEGDKILKNLPSIPTRTNDPNLVVLSLSASRLRSGGSATFIVLKQNEMLDTNLWCLFDDGSITPAYTLDVKNFSDNLLLLECSLNDYAVRRLWYQRTVDRLTNIYLASSTKIILRGSLDVPWSNWAEENEQALTLCTLSLHKELSNLIQWIEFHRLVGVIKFVIYNTFNSIDHLKSLAANYDEDFPGLIDVVQWNFSSQIGTDFHAEAQYDCFLRYGDVSEWIGLFDIDKYLIPPLPYETLTRFLSEYHGRRLRNSVILRNYHFCRDDYRQSLNNETVIERFIFRSSISANRRVKYLYRSRALDYVSFDTHQHESREKTIVLARYPSMGRLRTLQECSWSNDILDTSIRDRFAEHLRNRIDNQNIS